MKEQTLVEMKNKVDALIRVLQQVMDEQQHLTTLAAGTFETIKLLPGYDDAIKQLTEKSKQPVLEEPKLEI
jgi:peptidyl-tRNA hydrolase